MILLTTESQIVLLILLVYCYCEGTAGNAVCCIMLCCAVSLLCVFVFVFYACNKQCFPFVFFPISSLREAELAIDYVKLEILCECVYVRGSVGLQRQCSERQSFYITLLLSVIFTVLFYENSELKGR